MSDTAVPSPVSQSLRPQVPERRRDRIITRVGQVLLSVLPDNAVAIIVKSETDVNYANAYLELREPDGNTFYFGWDDNPDEAIDEITELLIDLRQVMTEGGREPWYGFQMAVQRDGTFDVDFSYGPPAD